MPEVVGSIKGAFNSLKDNPVLMVPFLVVFVLTTAISFALLGDVTTQLTQLSNGVADLNALTVVFEALVANIVNFSAVIIISSLLSLFGSLWAINIIVNPKKPLTENAKSGLSAFVPALGALILFGLLVVVLAAVAALTLFTLIIPLVIVVGLIYVSIRLLFYAQAVVIDKKGVVSSLKHSWELTKGNWWNTFGFLILFSIILAIISFIFSLFGQIHVLIPSLLNSVIIYGALLIGGTTLYYNTLKPATKAKKK